MVEKGFELSEASNTPVMMELRIRACHVRGSFHRQKNSLPRSRRATSSTARPKEFIYDRLAHPPAIFRQEKLKTDVRLPAARKFIVENRLNEVFPGPEKARHHRAGRPLQRPAALASACWAWPTRSAPARMPILVLNVVYPLVPEEIIDFCKDKSAVLVLEEGQPEFIEQEIATVLRRADVPRRSCTARTACTWPASTTSSRWCAACRSSSRSMRRTWIPLAVRIG